MSNLYDNETVSVIIPVYNASRYIGKAIESALNQTYKNIEIVLVDDCSKDNSRQIIEKYMKEHKNIIYHLQEKNLGAAVARNTALDLANGRYVAFLDSDDIWHENKIDKQLDLMKKEGATICFSAIEMIDENGKQIKGKRNVPNRVDYKFLLKNTIIATSAVVIDRNKTGNFSMPLRRGGQDYATWLKLMRNGVVAYGINETLVKYRICNNSLSSNKLKSIRQVWSIQTQEEKVKKFSALINVIYFAINAFKKRFLH